MAVFDAAAREWARLVDSESELRQCVTEQAKQLAALEKAFATMQTTLADVEAAANIQRKVIARQEEDLAACATQTFVSTAIAAALVGVATETMVNHTVKAVVLQAKTQSLAVQQNIDRQVNIYFFLTPGGWGQGGKLIAQTMEGPFSAVSKPIFATSG